MSEYTIVVPVHTGIEDETQKLRITPSRAEADCQLFLSNTAAGQHLLYYETRRPTLAVSVDELVTAMTNNLYTVDVAAERSKYREALQSILMICETRLNESPEIHAVADAAWSALKGEIGAEG